MQIEALATPMQLGVIIGSGGSGTIYQHPTDTNLVIKTNFGGGNIESLIVEVENMQIIKYRLRNYKATLKNLVLYKSVSYYQYPSGLKNIYIEIEKYDTDLNKYLIDKKNEFNLSLIDNVKKTLESILTAFRENGIMHKDIKPENILLNVDTRNVALADFGSVTIKYDNFNEEYYEEGIEYYKGTVFYMSPMAICNIESYKNDTWALACVLLNMITLYSTRTIPNNRDYFNVIRTKSISAAFLSILRIPIDISTDPEFTSERIMEALLDDNKSTEPCNDFVDCVKKNTNKLDGENIEAYIRVNRESYYKAFRNNRIKDHLDYILNIFKSFYDFSYNKEQTLLVSGGYKLRNSLERYKNILEKIRNGEEDLNKILGRNTMRKLKNLYMSQTQKGKK